eukprot:COSAG01_NODE_3729_length_5755_cov_7.355135_1_plen_33_part_10
MEDRRHDLPPHQLLPPTCVRLQLQTIWLQFPRP